MRRVDPRYRSTVRKDEIEEEVVYSRLNHYEYERSDRRALWYVAYVNVLFHVVFLWVLGGYCRLL
jgi:hypothetical protein